jgi:hypothetical protein
MVLKMEFLRYIYKRFYKCIQRKYKGNVGNDKKNGKWFINVINDDVETFLPTHL